MKKTQRERTVTYPSGICEKPRASTRFCVATAVSGAIERVCRCRLRTASAVQSCAAGNLASRVDVRRHSRRRVSRNSLGCPLDGWVGAGRTHSPIELTGWSMADGSVELSVSPPAPGSAGVCLKIEIHSNATLAKYQNPQNPLTIRNPPA